jgi:hypothetical protein
MAVAHVPARRPVDLGYPFRGHLLSILYPHDHIWAIGGVSYHKIWLLCAVYVGWVTVIRRRERSAL